MVVLGLLLFGVAVAAAVVLIAQNNDAMFTLHAIGNSWTLHVYWMLVIGLIIMAVGLIGVAIMQAGAVRYRRLRRTHDALIRDRERVSDEYPTGSTPTAAAPTPAAAARTDANSTADEQYATSGQRSRGLFRARHS